MCGEEDAKQILLGSVREFLFYTEKCLNKIILKNRKIIFFKNTYMEEFIFSYKAYFFFPRLAPVVIPSGKHGPTLWDIVKWSRKIRPNFSLYYQEDKCVRRINQPQYLTESFILFSQ